MEPELEARIRLNLTRRVASRGARRLVEKWKSLEAALAAPEGRLAEVKGVGPEAARLLKEQPPGAAQAEAARAEALGARIVVPGRTGGLKLLAEIHDPPLVLYAQGELALDGEVCVAVVGARRASAYGLRMAGEIARGLAQLGVCVVSGLARGADAAAHRGALAGGGRTVAVLGSGLDRVYPTEHAGLAQEIVRAGGAVVSEFPLGTPPLTYHFPRRNRIVSGLALGVVVTEAAEKSGSLITADWALEQGRQVMAVPSRCDDPGAGGCHRLIKEGGALVESAVDVLHVLEIPVSGSSENPIVQGRLAFPEAPPTDLTPNEERIFAAIESTPTHIDDLVEATGLPASTVFGTLTMLELKRVVKAWPGKVYQRMR